MPNVAGWPASCREGFEGCRGGRFRRLSSKAAVHGLHVPEAPSPGCDAGVGQRRWEGFEGGPKCLTLLSEAHKNRRGRPGTGEEKRQACRLPRTVWGRSKMPNVAGWPASCREGFEGCRGGRFRRLSSKAAVRGLHVPEAPSPGFRKPIRTEEVGLEQAKRRGRPASCRERFGGGPKCLTLLAGLPAAELSSKAAVHGLHVPEAPSPGCDAGKGLKADQNA